MRLDRGHADEPRSAVGDAIAVASALGEADGGSAASAARYTSARSPEAIRRRSR